VVHATNFCLQILNDSSQENAFNSVKHHTFFGWEKLRYCWNIIYWHTYGLLINTISVLNFVGKIFVVCQFVSALNFMGINFRGLISTSHVKHAIKSVVDSSVRNIILWWILLQSHHVVISCWTSIEKNGYSQNERVPRP